MGVDFSGYGGDPRFLKLLEEMAELHAKKQADYGIENQDPFANVRASQDWGIPSWLGALVRLNDKVVRLKTYARTGKLSNEGAEDSMLDIAVYALIALILHREEKRSKELDDESKRLEKEAELLDSWKPSDLMKLCVVCGGRMMVDIRAVCRKCYMETQK